MLPRATCILFRKLKHAMGRAFVCSRTPPEGKKMSRSGPGLGFQEGIHSLAGVEEGLEEHYSQHGGGGGRDNGGARWRGRRLLRQWEMVVGRG